MPSPLRVPNGVRCTALTFTCTTLGPTLEATRATGSSASVGEDESDKTCGEALAALSSWGAGCLCEHPASNTTASNVASKAERVLYFRFNVQEPPVGARGASFATE